MSLPTNDNTPIITLGNYEEYFLLYVDDELTPQEKGMVEAFVQLHPHLQAELELLMGAKLPPEAVNFRDKESLFAQNIGEWSIDEALLLYVDEELDEAQAKKTAEKLEKDAAYQKQYQWLLRTKSNNAEVVPYPDKKELYRHTAHRIRRGFALRVAAAVLLVASMGILYLQEQKGPASQPVATIPKKSTRPAHAAGPADRPFEDAPATGMEKKAQPQTASVPDASKTVVAAVQPARTKAAKKATIPKNPMPQEAIPTSENNAVLAYEPASAPRKRHADAQLPAPGKKELEKFVTPDPVSSYHTPEAPAEASFASSKEDGRSKGNLKSLLRKATRLVERRTGISATNEEEELLIGVVALKLK